MQLQPAAVARPLCSKASHLLLSRQSVACLQQYMMCVAGGQGGEWMAQMQ